MPSPSSGGTAHEAASGAGSTIHFRDISREAGLTTVPHSSAERRYIVETMGGGGIALFDCDNDGKLDIAVVNDSTMDRYLAGGDPMITLYHQDGSGGKIHFTDITQAAGLATRGWGMAIAVGDYDNDGLPDLYVTGYGHNVLYHNLGGCRFEDVTDRAGVKLSGFSTGAAWADYDRDGHVDLFVARYVETDLHHLPPANPEAKGYRSVILQVPDEMQGESDFLLRNRGDGTFEDVSQKAGVSNPAKLHGMGVVWGDYDNDGWPDLFVANDGGRNYLYHNRGNGTFDEDGVVTGTAFGADGEIFGNMAADFGDFNHDGLLDLVTTRYSRQPASLYRNDGVAFTDVASEVGLARDTVAPVKWGTGFADFDNDGWPDILIANGNFSSLMDKLPGEVKFREPMQLFRNIEGRAFDDVSSQAGLNTGPLESRRGIAFGDINNDGNLDFVVFNVDGAPSLFINESHNANHRVLFRLVGSKSNRMAIGARVTVDAGGMQQIDEVRAGGGYNSSNDTRLHFGLGKAAIMSRVEVRWPSGLRQEFQNLPADALYEIDEGQGIHKLTAFQPPPTR
ncbi:MAG TPA: CRTAC1 family protein [Acidobacteriaceae bacterium]|nr:CRTAC1 family protein [Acidobacteriaceae bacterium]